MTIDRSCENFIALFQPVATDLRFVLSTLKINTNLERIADIACGISEFVSDSDERFNSEIIKQMDADKMLSLSIEMVKGVARSLYFRRYQNGTLVYKKDKMLDKLMMLRVTKLWIASINFRMRNDKPCMCFQ